MSFIYNIITSSIGLPILDSIWEWAILLVLGTITYNVAFGFVGDFYRDGLIHGRAIGSVLHWVTRTSLFFIIWLLTYGVIWIGKLIYSNWQVFVGIIFSIFLIFIGTNWYKTKYQKQSV